MKKCRTVEVHSKQNISEPELRHRNRRRDDDGSNCHGGGGDTGKGWVLFICAIAWRSSPPSPYPGGWPAHLTVKDARIYFATCVQRPGTRWMSEKVLAVQVSSRQFRPGAGEYGELTVTSDLELKSARKRVDGPWKDGVTRCMGHWQARTAWFVS
jgi:hypothetical protein